MKTLTPTEKALLYKVAITKATAKCRPESQAYRATVQLEHARLCRINTRLLNRA